MKEVGLDRHSPSPSSLAETQNEWNYTSLKNSPPSHPHSEQWSSSIYRGVVPAKNIFERDFAVNGAIVRRSFSFNNNIIDPNRDASY
jgi:hypothetical protein